MFLSSLIQKRPQPTDAIDPVLYTVKPYHITKFVMELTNYCNLRCRYCHQNRPDFTPGSPLNDEMFAGIVEYLCAHPVKRIDLTGGGDILVAPRWAEKCCKLLDLGIRLDTTINLGLLLEDEEIDLIARFNVISVSIDTVDRKVLAMVRKSVDIRTITYNIMRIKAAALRNGNKRLRWIISAVYSAEVVNRLPELASFAAALGARAFQIQDLMIFNDIKDNVTPVWELKGRDIIRAVEATKEAIRLASRAGLIVRTPPHFLARLDEFAATAAATPDEPVVSVLPFRKAA